VPSILAFESLGTSLRDTYLIVVEGGLAALTRARNSGCGKPRRGSARGGDRL